MKKELRQKEELVEELRGNSILLRQVDAINNPLKESFAQKVTQLERQVQELQ